MWLNVSVLTGYKSDQPENPRSAAPSPSGFQSGKHCFCWSNGRFLPVNSLQVRSVGYWRTKLCELLTENKLLNCNAGLFKWCPAGHMRPRSNLPVAQAEAQLEKQRKNKTKKMQCEPTEVILQMELQYCGAVMHRPAAASLRVSLGKQEKAIHRVCERLAGCPEWGDKWQKTNKKNKQMWHLLLKM